jgi:hypothetical protein
LKFPLNDFTATSSAAFSSFASAFKKSTIGS